MAAASGLRGEIYKGSSGLGLSAHFNPETYRYLAAQFSTTPSDQYSDQKRNINRFLNGQVIDPSDTAVISP